MTKAERQKKYTLAHPERVKEAKKNWWANHPEYGREYARNWRKNNPERHKETQKKADAKKRLTAKGRLSNNLSKAMRRSLHGAKAGRAWESLVSYTVNELKHHLETLFQEGMSWENYGTVWEIDHKIPVAVFKYDKPEDIDFRICWSLKNLQPLGKRENRSKGARLDNPFQPLRNVQDDEIYANKEENNNVKV